MKNNKSIFTTAFSIIAVVVISLFFGFSDEKTTDSTSSSYFSESVYQSETISEDTDESSFSDSYDDFSKPVSENSSTEIYLNESELLNETDNNIILEEGSYTTPEDVAEYIHTFGSLPHNFITKKEAESLGWISSKGNLWEVAEGMSIGGDHFGNYEGLLPDADGRKWTECDVNYNGGFRGAERIIFSNDGLIFYTDDHYKTFKKMY